MREVEVLNKYLEAVTDWMNQAEGLATVGPASALWEGLSAAGDKAFLLRNSFTSWGWFALYYVSSALSRGIWPW